MTLGFVKRIFPSWQNAVLAILAAVLLILAFPDSEFWFLAWFALVPLMWAVEREKASIVRSFVLGWIFGTIFFFGTSWWLAYAPIHYAGFPPVLAYLLIFCVTAITGLFPAIFAGTLSVLLRRFGFWAFLGAPFVWVFTEFLRYWLTGNNWNAIGYSQAFIILIPWFAQLGGVLLVSFICLVLNSVICILFVQRAWGLGLVGALTALVFAYIIVMFIIMGPGQAAKVKSSEVIAIQPNVPMSGLDSEIWQQLRERQRSLSRKEIWDLRHPRVRLKPGEPAPTDPTEPPNAPLLVVFPESPMNFMYSDDREFQKFINDFARENNVSVLFNSEEPDKGTTKYFNSAVMVGPDGKEVAEYDKIYLLPFGEAVPSFLEGIVPGFVGNFAYGREYDLFPVGDAKAGVMICFESHFGQLSREYVRKGADVIIEMTNDGYLGPTPVLRQHLANAVFRAVETNRPVLRVTNVGITAYIDGRGQVLDPTAGYTEDTRVWSVSKSDGKQTFYVRFGDWFAWLCSAFTLGLLMFAGVRKNRKRGRQFRNS